MPSLSLCMIVKNEEDYLEQCLNSVKDMVDEIIIVDTGSNDKTAEIAAKFGAKVVKHEWKNDFSDARNVYLKYATKDWVLVLDADEVIAKEDLAEIKRLIENKDVMGYYLVQRTYSNDSNLAGWIPSVGDSCGEKKDYKGYITGLLARLFQNRKGISYEGVVHESVKGSIEKIGGKLEKTQIPIHHYGKVRDKDHVDKKKELYLGLGKEKIKTNDAKAYYELGVQSQVLGKYKEAIGFFDKALEIEPNYNGCWLNKGGCYFELGELDNAKKSLNKANEIEANSDAYNNLGLVYEKEGDSENAEQAYLRALKLNPLNVSTYNNISRLYFSLKQIDKVAFMLIKLLEIEPNNETALNNLGGIYLQQKNPVKAVEIMEKLVKLYPDRHKDKLKIIEQLKG